METKIAPWKVVHEQSSLVLIRILFLLKSIVGAFWSGTTPCYYIKLRPYTSRGVVPEDLLCCNWESFRSTQKPSWTNQPQSQLGTLQTGMQVSIMKASLMFRVQKVYLFLSLRSLPTSEIYFTSYLRLDIVG